jgi:hypothetical protein
MQEINSIIGCPLPVWPYNKPTMLSAKVRQTTFLQVLTDGVFSSCFLVVFPDPDGSEFLVLLSDPDPGDTVILQFPEREMKHHLKRSISIFCFFVKRTI